MGPRLVKCFGCICLVCVLVSTRSHSELSSLLQAATMKPDGKRAAACSWSRKFATRLSLHGIPDLAQANTRPKCLFWTVIVVFSFSMMFKSVARIVLEFATEPTLSKVSTFSPTRLPPVTVCPSHWIDLNRLNWTGFDVAEIQTFLRYLHPTYSVPEGEVDEELLLKLQRYNGTYDQLFESISILDFARCSVSHIDSSVLSCRITGGVTGGTYCYTVHLTNNFSHYQFMYARMRISFSAEAWVPVKQSIAITAVPVVSLWVKPRTNAIIRQGDQVEIALEAMKIRRVHTSAKPCRKYTPLDVSKCVMEMWNDICRRLNLKQIWSPGSMGRFDVGELTKPRCAFNISFDRLVFNDAVLNDRCPLPCEQDTFKALASRMEPLDGEASSTDRNGSLFSNNSDAFVDLFYADPANSIMIEERFLYNLDVLVSNLGGQISLWTGASIVTLWQIAYYMVHSDQSDVSPIAK